MKKFLSKYIGTGLLLYIVFNVVLLALSLIFGLEDSMSGPNFPSALVFAVLMGLIVILFLRRIKPVNLKVALTYSIFWTLVVLVLLVLVTIANDTTNLFFGTWFNWLPFVAMAGAPLIQAHVEGKLSNILIVTSVGTLAYLLTTPATNYIAEKIIGCPSGGSYANIKGKQVFIPELTGCPTQTQFLVHSNYYLVIVPIVAMLITFGLLILIQKRSLNK